MSSAPHSSGPAQDRTIIVVPTFNEAENLPALIAELLAIEIPRLAVLIVDDNSPDGTGEVADQLSLRFPATVFVLHRLAKQGLGKAYVEGFGRALEMGARYVVQMDADFSHPPATISRMLDAIEEYDVVVGSRYVAGGQLDERWGWWRRLLSWWANEVWSRRLLRLRTRDITAGFKCWKRATLLGIGLHRVFSDGYAFQVEMTFLSERLHYRILEIPIHFEDRRIGKSKMSVAVKLQGAVDVFRIWIRHHNAKRAE